MGSLRFVPADEGATEQHWVVLAAWPSLVLLPGAAPSDLVQQVWDALGTEEASLEAVVSSIPLRGAVQAESFAVIRFASTDDAGCTATVVVRGRAAVDLLSVGGSRRFGSGGAQPWALAEFGSVTGVVAGAMCPVPESTLRLPPEARRLDHGVARALRVFWADSSEDFAAAVDAASSDGGRIASTSSSVADDDTVVRPRSSVSAASGHDHDSRGVPDPDLRTGHEAPEVEDEDRSAIEPAAPHFLFRVGDGPVTELGGPVVIGRRPQPRVGYSTEAPRLVTVDSPAGKVSQNHVELAPVGRTVVITDLRSTNGTVVTVGGSGPRRLRQGDSAVVSGSAIVEIGDGNVIHISSRDRENTETTV